MAEKQRLLSAVKPTGKTHIGNYFGAMKQFVELQDKYDCFIMIADYHALTTAQDPQVLKQDTLDVAIDYLAIGLDPGKVTLFKQSEAPAHTELAWVFNCLTTMPYLSRAHAYKDASAKNKEVSVGTFTYPLLMAADILLYDTNAVPVGLDQKQHVEIARDTALKFNRLYGNIFRVPEALILEQVKTVVGLDGRKMSKSYNNTIPLFAPEIELKNLVMSIKTDSKDVAEPKDPEQCNVFALHKLFSQTDLPALEKRYRAGGIGYQESKEILLKNIDEYLTPMRKRRKELAASPAKVETVLRGGAEKARQVSGTKMQSVREAIGAA